ncbi:MAG: hypothetical protein ACLP1X_29185 [Polyangiaceae bacterium]|jgi:hypothetical protein
MAKDKTGKEFERLTQRVFAALHRQENVRSVRVEHDVSIDRDHRRRAPATCIGSSSPL